VTNEPVRTEIDITPEPDPAQREALAEAVIGALERPADPWGGWWREGVRENVFDGSAEAGDPSV
jgi:hypothetical protein